MFLYFIPDRVFLCSSKLVEDNANDVLRFEILPYLKFDVQEGPGFSWPVLKLEDIQIDHDELDRNHNPLIF